VINMVLFLTKFLSFIMLMFSDISNSDDCSTSQSHVNIVILGSSTAEGAGATKLENSWVFKLEHELKILNNSSRVVNFGKSGYSTFHILPNEQFFSGRPNPDKERNITKALSLNPTMVIINMPSNDAAYGFSNVEQLRNYRTLIELLKNRNIDYLICSPQPRNFKEIATRQRQFTLVELMRKEFDRHFVDVWSGLTNEEFGLKNSYNSGDGIHLNDDGHNYIFQQVFARIK